MSRLAHRYLPPLLYFVFGLAVVAYAYDTTKVVDLSLAVNQMTLDIHGACILPPPPGWTPPTFQSGGAIIELGALR